MPGPGIARLSPFNSPTPPGGQVRFPSASLTRNIRIRPEALNGSAHTLTNRPQTIRTALIVDDNETFLRLMEGRLADFGGPNLTILKVDPTHPIDQQVYGIVTERTIDLIFMDGRMPGCTGIELTDALRNSFGFTGFIAAISDTDAAQIREKGGDFIVDKATFHPASFLMTAQT